RPHVSSRLPLPDALPISYHPGAHRVQFDIAVAAQQISLLSDDAGAKAPLPQRSRAPVRAIGVLRMTLTKMLHQARNPAPILRRRSEEHTSELQSRENLVC